jgi:hypothetical protein
MLLVSHIHRVPKHQIYPQENSLKKAFPNPLNKKKPPKLGGFSIGFLFMSINYWSGFFYRCITGI